MTIKFTLNDKAIKVEGSQKESLKEMPLLWFIRENAGLKGTKFGCGIGQCGACTVHLDGRAMRSCSVTLQQIDGSSVTTIEGLSKSGEQLHPVQQAWAEIDVPQCGYCQAGQIMAVSAMLAESPEPTDEIIDQQLTNICRCGTYVRIRKAIKTAAENLIADKKSPP